MQVVELVENGNLKLNQREKPELKEGEYLIKIAAVGICNSDIYRGFAKGAYHYPLVMGHEISGQIIEVGSSAKLYSVGTNVTIYPLIPCGECLACQKKEWVHCQNYSYYGSRRDGGYQEYLAVKEWNVLPVLEGVDVVHASLTEPVAVCSHAVNLINSKKGDKAVVVGAGLLGVMTALILKDSMNFDEVVVVDRNEFKLQIARDLGLQAVLNSDVEKIGNQFDIVIEACGASETYTSTIGLARSQATVVWMGNAQGSIEFTKSQISSILRKELLIKGTWNSVYKGGVDDDWIAALKMIRNSKKIPQLISHQISLSELPSFLQQMFDIKSSHRPHDIIKGIVVF